MTISPAILSIATGVPPYRHNQLELHDQQLAPYINSHRARSIFLAAEIDTRHSVLANADFFAGDPGTLARNTRYLEAAHPLATATIGRALAQASLSPTDIDHFIVISCTGFETPGLDVSLAASLKMRPNLRRSALIGMGCQAGITGLDRALLEVTARPGSRVLLLAVEFGTLHFQQGGKLDNMVAGAIFGDGLAVAVIAAPPAAQCHPHVLQTATFSDYTYQDLLGFHLSDHGFQIHLSTRVAKVLHDIVPGLVGEFLGQANLSPADITFWAIHPGGAKIVDYVAEALGLGPADVYHSRQVLRQYGNMSSATIFFVLHEIWGNGQPQPGQYALLLSFGPGLTIELCLVQWRAT